MRRKLRTLVLVCVLAAAVSAASAQEAGKKTAPATAEKKIRIELAEEPALVLGSMRITLGKAMEWAVKQNFDMLSVSYEVAMLDTQYSQFLKKFAPQLIVEGSGAYSRNTPSQRLMAGETVTQAKVDAKIAKNFMSGTTIVGGVNYEYDDFNGRNSIFGGMSGPANAHKPGVFVMVQQELLKNAFGITDRQVQEIIKNESKKKKDIILFQLSLIIVQVVGEYWNTVMSKVSLENAELQVKETRKVRDITARNAAYGLADDYTLRLYNSMLAGAEAKVVMTRQKYREALRSFLTTINVDENMEVTGTAVFSNKYPSINVEEALKTAFEKRADYQNALRDVESAKAGIKIAESNSLPSLTASLSGMLSAENGSFGGAISKDFGQAKYHAFEGKLNLTYPLGDNELYIQERNARFRVRQAELQLQKYKRKVKDDILNSTDYIEASYRLYQKGMEARRQSELFYQGMMRDLGLGRLNSAVVKNALDAMVQSREMELQALVGYNISLLQYDVARNVLFEKYGIDVEKYIPKDTGK